MGKGKKDREAFIARIRDDVSRQLSSKPRRLEHSLRVADTAVELARTYGVDPFEARVAGLLHDYAKAYSADAQIEKAREIGLDFGCDLELVASILHGPIAAFELEDIYPELTPGILSAIEHHTVPSDHMSPLDMVVYIADGIEPGRPSNERIDAQRASVGKVPLDELFFDCFAGSIAYVIDTGRFLWPGTVETYNRYVLNRKR